MGVRLSFLTLSFGLLNWFLADYSGHNGNAWASASPVSRLLPRAHDRVISSHEPSRRLYSIVQVLA